MDNGYKKIEEIIKKIPLERIEEAYKKDVQHNEILYKTIYNLLTAGEPIYKIKMMYGEIGMMMLMKILIDNNIPISKRLEEEFYYNEFREKLKTRYKYLNIVSTLFVIWGAVFIMNRILDLLIILIK